MSSGASISVIICTRNRAADLTRTLAALDRIRIPPNCQVELITVDNGSTDTTAEVLRATTLRQMRIRRLNEPRVGMCNARNAGLAIATGDIILFTDDDVVPAHDWLAQLSGPLIAGKWDAVAGRIELAPHLLRAWMAPLHRLWLAAVENPHEFGVELVGANMGFRRAVLDKVPMFDPELGPGRLGFGDDTLFSFQLEQAGYRIGFVSNACIEHHPARSRLQRKNWLESARARGRTQAYLLHHWHHGSINFPHVIAAYFAAKLRLRRMLQGPIAGTAEGCALWEISYVATAAKCRQFAIERTRVRNYERHGLRKLGTQAAFTALCPQSEKTCV